MDAGLTRQQLCATLQVSESTVRRLEQAGMPVMRAGPRSPRYDLPEVKKWLKEQGCQSGQTNKAVSMSESWSANAFTDAYRKVHLRVTPSS
jgi:phage terminase Nu1 subunit (DNA packaging protein)